MATDVRVTEDDPVIAARCPACTDRHGNGRAVKATYYGKTFNNRQWRRGPLCENCESPLVELHRVRLD